MPLGLTQKFPRSLPQPLSRVQISTMSVKDNLFVAGGFHGELICKVFYQCSSVFILPIPPWESKLCQSSYMIFYYVVVPESAGCVIQYKINQRGECYH